jgi:hypothetical protein
LPNKAIQRTQNSGFSFFLKGDIRAADLGVVHTNITKIMKDIKAINQANLLSALKDIDIRVPPRKQGRTTEHGERWSICRLLATLAKNDFLAYPLEFIKRPKRQPPDFSLRNGHLDIGIEVTEAINEDYAKATTLPEADERGAVIDPSLFKWGSSRKKLHELRTIVKQRKLTGPGWEGNSVEIEYANAIIEKTLAKTKLLNKHYEKFLENWLLIYCNLTIPMLDIKEANQIFTEKAAGY